MPRINFISKKEILQFEIPHSLNYNEQKYFFHLPKNLEEFILSCDDNHILIFIILYGHFKHTNKFYTLSQYNEKDIEFIKNAYHLKILHHNLSLNVKTLQRYKNLIKQPPNKPLHTRDKIHPLKRSQ